MIGMQKTSCCAATRGSVELLPLGGKDPGTLQQGDDRGPGLDRSSEVHSSRHSSAPTETINGRWTVDTFIVCFLEFIVKLLQEIWT